MSKDHGSFAAVASQLRPCPVSSNGTYSLSRRVMPEQKSRKVYGCLRMTSLHTGRTSACVATHVSSSLTGNGPLSAPVGGT